MKTPIDYQLVAIFVAVADEASFSRAARRLGLGKGTVSRGVARLEALLGTQLIHRTTHQVALSTAGTALYERTAVHLAALDQAVVKLPERAEQPSGELRLTAPNDFGVMVLPELLAQFSLRYPEIGFDVRLTNARVDLVAEGYDLAIRALGGKQRDSSLTGRRIGGGEIAFYSSPTYVARRGEPRQLADPRHEWIAHPAMRSRGALPRDLCPRFVADDFLLVRNLLREGVGVGPLPTFVGEVEVRAGRLVAVLPGERVRGPAGLYLFYPSSGQVSRKVAAFRDFLVEWLKARPVG